MDEEKIVEVLFENSEEIRNDVYINIMYTLQQYHDNQVNETEVLRSFNTLSPSIYSKIKRYIINDERYFNFCDCIVSIMFFIIIAFIFVAIIYESKPQH